ncbi:MAG: ribosomal RNA small subunit methyltransferase A, partial [Planctomycetaceae bacterium]
FHDTCRALFFHRRKFLRSVIISAMKDRLDKTQVDELMAAEGYQAQSRIEQLSVAEIGELIERLRQKIASVTDSMA